MDRKAAPEDMTELANYSSTARLLDFDPARNRPINSLQQRNSKFRDFLRHVRFSLLGLLLRRVFKLTSSQEQYKVASYRSRSMAALNSLLHLLPLCGAIVLLLLHLFKYFVGGSSDNATTLQFVAKFHELLMQASLVDILLYLIRAQAIGGYIPLGALSGVAQAPQLSYLWSLDFISAIISPAFSAWRKVAFALSVSGLLFMTAVVGPSSAILMIPRPGMPNSEQMEVRYMNASEETIFPTHLNHTHALNFSSWFDVDRPNKIIMLENATPRDHRKVRTYLWTDDDDTSYPRIAATSMPDGFVADPPGGNYTIVTVPTSLSARQLTYHLPDSGDNKTGWMLLANSSFTVRTLQPVVLTVCSPSSWAGREEVQYFSDDGSTHELSTATKLYEEILKLNETGPRRIDFYGNFAPLWKVSPTSPASLLGVFLSTTNYTGDSFRKFFQVCTISSFWWTTEATTSPGVGWRPRTEVPESRKALARVDTRPIAIDLQDMPSLNSADALDIWTNSGTISTLGLGLAFATAISSLPGSSRPGRNYTSSSWRYDLANGYNRTVLIGSQAITSFNITSRIYGYGYGATSTSLRLSVAVMIAYCITTFLYLVYIIATGHTSVAWDSATELILLALQSKTPDHLGAISVGIDSVNTLRQSVGIRVSRNAETAEEKLELVFACDEDIAKRSLRKIERNKAY